MGSSEYIPEQRKYRLGQSVECKSTDFSPSIGNRDGRIEVPESLLHHAKFVCESWLFLKMIILQNLACQAKLYFFNNKLKISLKDGNSIWSIYRL